MKGEQLLQYESVQNWLKSVGDSAFSRGKAGLTENAKRMRLHNLWRYTDKGKINPDDLLEEAKTDIDKAERIDHKYYAWTGKQSEAKEGVMSFIQKRKPKRETKVPGDLPEFFPLE